MVAEPILFMEEITYFFITYATPFICWWTGRGEVMDIIAPTFEE